jgi:hypothetical protein
MKFSNLEIAKISAINTFKKGTNFDYAIVIGNYEYSIKDCQKIGAFYQTYDKNGKKIFIQEIYKHNVERIGYLCFENGDNERCDKDYGLKRSKQLFDILADAILFTLHNNLEFSINKIEKVSNKEYIIYVKDSTARIHIMANSKIMTINQIRSFKEQRCIPFIKKVDKFLTIFVFTSIDRGEKRYMNYEEKINSIINQIIQYYLDNSDLEEHEIKFLPVEFEGFIQVDKDIKSTESVEGFEQYNSTEMKGVNING